MPIQHRLISDPEIHEPKGISNAPSNTAYHANGNGSGTWKAIDKNSLGIPGGNVGDTVVIGNGDTFTSRNDFAYGSMHIVNNTTPYVWDSHPTFGSSDQFRYLNGQGCPWTSLTTNTRVLASNGSLTALVAGLYRYDMDIVFDGLGPRTSLWTPIRGGFTLNGAANLYPCNTFFATSIYRQTETPSETERMAVLKLTAFLQLTSGSYLNPAFEPYTQQYAGAIVRSGMVALTLIRGS